MKIILDTNFLVYCAKNKIDYVEEISNLLNGNYELVVPKQVIEELEKIKNKKSEHIPFVKRIGKFKKTTGKDKLAADLALQLLSKRKIKIVNAHGENIGQKFLNFSPVSPSLKSQRLGDVDKAIINLANENKKNIVCTLDREMRGILGRVILINRFKRLMLTK